MIQKKYGIKQERVLVNVINKSKKLKGDILTIGITNQRETTILWDKSYRQDWFITR